MRSRPGGDRWSPPARASEELGEELDARITAHRRPAGPWTSPDSSTRVRRALRAQAYVSLIDGPSHALGRHLLVPAGLVTHIDSEAEKITVAATRNEIGSAPRFRTVWPVTHGDSVRHASGPSGYAGFNDE
ncbi:hypothetical protein [Streptomyces bluensis]|uniref:hypothetical protein n=1 Tax=Streptomyces bluensis TaxID=33897 RepID=UPI003317CD4B